jgi:WS/DGAT C-terminal domain
MPSKRACRSGPSSRYMASWRSFPTFQSPPGLRTGVSIFSYCGQLTFGITGDYATTADIEVLAGGIDDGAKEMSHAGRHRRAGAAVENSGKVLKDELTGPPARLRAHVQRRG